METCFEINLKAWFFYVRWHRL